MHLLIYHLNTQDNLYCIIFNSALIFSNLQFVFTFRGVLKIHKNTNHLPRPLFLLSHCQDPISTPQHYLNTPILQYVWVIDQVWDQDGWILVKFFFHFQWDFPFPLWQKLNCKSTLKVKSNNKVARRHSLPTPLNILLCNLPMFHKHYSNEKPFRASLMTALNSLARVTGTTLGLTSAMWCQHLTFKAEICIKEEKIDGCKKNSLWLNYLGQREIFAHLINQFGLTMNN